MIADFLRTLINVMLVAVAVIVIDRVVVSMSFTGISGMDLSDPTHTADGIRYFSDGRTKLCFAAYGRRWDTYYTMTEVPCSDEVINVIKAQNE